MHWADYAYDGLRPTLRLSSSDFDRTYGDLLQDDHGAPTTPSASAPSAPTSPSTSPASTPRRQSPSATATANSPGSPRCRRGRVTTASCRRPARSVPRISPGPSPTPTASRSRSAPRAAGVLDLWLEHYQEGFGSEYTFTQASLDWNEYIALPAPRHVLAARLFVGGMTGGPPQQGVFSLGGGAPGGVEYAPDDTAPAPARLSAQHLPRGAGGSRQPGVPLPAPRGRPRRRLGPLLPASPPRGAVRGCRRGLDRRGVSRRRTACGRRRRDPLRPLLLLFRPR